MNSDSLSGPVVSFDDVRIGFDKGDLLNGLSFCVGLGEMMFLIGDSGAGKELALLLEDGLLQPATAKQLVLGHAAQSMTEHELLGFRRRIGFVFQEGALFDSL